MALENNKDNYIEIGWSSRIKWIENVEASDYYNILKRISLYNTINTVPFF